MKVVKSVINEAFPSTCKPPVKHGGESVIVWESFFVFGSEWLAICLQSKTQERIN